MTASTGVAGGAGRVRGRPWATVAALAVTETVSWGVLYYAFAAFQVPIARELGWSAAELAGALSVALAVSGAAGLAVGRHLDARGPRRLFTFGSIAAALLVVAWSRVETLPALYAVWALIGLAMAAVLYEPAFVVLAKAFPDAAERRRAMTAMTLVGALASFVFLPASQALIDALGWRDALLALAGVLAVVTVPLHALVLSGPPPAPPAAGAAAGARANARDALRSAAFWLTSGAFFAGSLAAVAVTVHAIPLLLERGHSAAFAAWAVGLIGIAQIPGRLLFAPLAGRLGGAAASATTLGAVAGGIALVAAAAGAPAIVAGLVLLGMGNGMATLTRASVLADRYGQAAYGTIAGVAGACTTAARALGPVAAAGYATWLGYDALLWTLAAVVAAAAAATWAGGRAPVAARVL